MQELVEELGEMAYLDKGVDQVGAGRALGHHLQVKKNHYDDKDYARWSSPKVRHGSGAPVVHAIRGMLHGVFCTLYDAAATLHAVRYALHVVCCMVHPEGR